MVSRKTGTSLSAGALSAVLCAAAFSAVAGATPAGAATAGRTPLAGTVVPAAARAHPAGAVPKSARVDFEVVLRLQNEAAAQALAKAVSLPGTAAYRHYLTESQWEARFSPAAAEVSSARSWLASEGFALGAVSKDRITVSASGTAAQVENAFGTGLENYKVNGRVVRMATRELSVPASLAGSVVGAMGINQEIATTSAAAGSAARGRAAASPASVFPPAPAAFVTAPPCGSYYGALTTKVTPPFMKGYPSPAPDEVCGYKPGQFRSAYDIGSLTGKGATVAVVDAYGSATIAQDTTQYFKANDPGNPFANAHFSQIDATPFANESICDASGWATEQAIDVESVHAMAPGARILYVGAQDCINGLFDAEQQVIDGGLADVVTNSWGDSAGDLLDDVTTKTAYDDLFMLADTTGITVLFSSGDDGDNFDSFGFSSADYPASSPFVTAVGGTSLKIAKNGHQAGQAGQLGWATGRSIKCTANIVGDIPGCTAAKVNKWLPVTYDGGSGGFTSYGYTQPYYQAPVVPASLALRNEALTGSAPMRVEPDISLDADPSTGFLIGLHETFPNGKVMYAQTRYGGTSLASPLLAGVIADADQASAAHGGAAVGFINPAIYRLDTMAGAIEDIRPGGPQAEYRVDHADTFVPNAKGFIQSLRELTYEGPLTYCDETGNCASRPNTLTTSHGFDSMTGLGSIGPRFIADLSRF
jgi:subtilase family serine protease